jgi:hypothetical protein
MADKAHKPSVSIELPSPLGANLYLCIIASDDWVTVSAEQNTAELQMA